MFWGIFVIINLITASLLIPLQRLLLRKEKIDTISFIVITQALCALLLVPFAIIHGFQLPDIHKHGAAIVTMFVLYALGHIIYVKTLKRVEASVFSTLLNISTVWVVLMGYVFLKEKFDQVDLIGTFLILFSTVLLVERKSKFSLNKSIVMGLVVGCIFGIASSLWVYIGKSSDLLTWTMLSFAGTPLILLLFKPNLVSHLKHFINNKSILLIVLIALVWSIDNIASLAAYKLGKVSVVAPLLQTSIILSVLVSILFLHERSRLYWKLLAAVVCFMGVVLLIS
jgi:drug/metabolite transporter (DMT)-like permease